MIRKYAKIIAVLTFIMFFNTLFLIKTSPVYADDSTTNYSCDVIIEADKGAIKKGETVTYKVTAKNINAGAGITTFAFLLDYDTSLFDIDVVGENNLGAWKYVNGSPADGNSYVTMVQNIEEPAKADGTIMAIIKFTAKTNITSGVKNISFKNMQIGTGKDLNDAREIKIEDSTQKLIIIDSCDISVSKDKVSVKKGETVTFSIKASNIKGVDGIATFMFQPIYDKNTFICNVKLTDSEAWGRRVYENVEGIYATASENLKPTLEDSIIAKVELTAKESATIGTKTIEFKNMMVGFKEGETTSGSYLLPNQSTVINIVESQQSGTGEQEKSENPQGENNQGQNSNQDEEKNKGEDNSDDGENENGNTNTEFEDNEDEYEDNDDEEENNDNGRSKSENSSNSSNFPKTGIGDAIIPLIIAIGALAGVSFFKYKQINIK